MDNQENTNSQNENINYKQPTVQAAQPPVKDKRRHFLAAFFLSFMWGIFGVDRFYLGKIWTGILKLITFGGFGIWVMVDLAVIVSGGMRDKQGNELIDAAKYKRFASNTLSLFATALSLIIIVSGIFIYLGVSEFIKNGGIDQYLPKGDTSQTQSLDIGQILKLIQNQQQ